MVDREAYVVPTAVWTLVAVSAGELLEHTAWKQDCAVTHGLPVAVNPQQPGEFSSKRVTMH